MKGQAGKRHVLLLGGGFVNKGAEAMTLTVRDEILKRLPRADISAVVTRGEAEACKAVGIAPVFRGQESWPKRVSGIAGGLAGDAGLRQLALRFPKEIGYIAKFKGVDVVLDVSGFRYTNKFGTAALNDARLAACAAVYMRSRGGGYVFMPQAWGPFDGLGREYEAFLRQAVQASVLACVRDGRSEEYLKAFIGCESQIERCPDIAFRFEGLGPERGRDFLALAGLDTSRPVIGIVPNMQVYSRVSGPRAMDHPYVRGLRQIVADLLANTPAGIVLMPHSMGDGVKPEHDDRRLCEWISSGITEGGRVVTLLDDLSAAELKGVIGACELLIGSRFHSLVAALSQRVPVVAIGWSHKYSELLELFGMRDALLDVSAGDSAERGEYVMRAWQQRLEHSDLIGAVLPTIQERVDRLFETIMEKTPSLAVR